MSSQLDLSGRTGFSQTTENLEGFLDIHPEPLTESKLAVLDVTRISDRMLVMGRCWSHRTDKDSHRNNINEVASYLNTKYGKNYVIWNLGSPDTLYDTALFRNQIMNFSQSRALSPSLKSLFNICRSLTAWLSMDTQHVAIIQCKNGLGRSGLAVACFLRYCELFDSTYESFEYFVQKRSPGNTAWVTVTLRRYLRYFNDVLILNGRVPNPLPLQLHQVILNTVPNFDGDDSCNPGIEVYQNGRLTYSSRVRQAELDAGLTSSMRALNTGSKSKRSSAEDCNIADTFEDDELVKELKISMALKDVPIQDYNPLVLKDNNHVVFRLEDLVLDRDVQIRIYHHNEQSAQNMTILNLVFNTGFVAPGLIRLRPSDMELPFSTHPPPAPSSKQSSSKLSSTRFSPEFSVDIIVTPIEDDPKQVSYENVTVQSRAKNLLKLSQFHTVRPDPLLIQPLELQGHRKFFSRLALQLRNNDIHWAHELLSHLVRTSFYGSLDKELVSLGKLKYDKMRTSHQKENSNSSIIFTPRRQDSYAGDELSESGEIKSRTQSMEILEEVESDVGSALNDVTRQLALEDSTPEMRLLDGKTFESSPLAQGSSPSTSQVVIEANSKDEASLMSADESGTPLVSADESGTPLVSADESGTPLVSADESGTPLVSADESGTPLVSADESGIPLVPVNESIAPLMPTDESGASMIPEKNVVLPPLVLTKGAPPPPPPPMPTKGAPPPPPPLMPKKGVPPPPPPMPKKGAPPPPPMPTKGAPPPPPSAPIGKNTASTLNRDDNSTTTTAEEVQKPKIRNKLHWEELKDKQRLRNTVWLELLEQLPDYDPASMDVHKFEEKSFTEGDQGKLEKSSAKPLVKILDLRRVNNVGIGLSRFYKRLTDAEIFEAIISRQTTILSLDDLLTLKPLMPTPEERASLLLYKGPISELGTAEKFMLVASKEPHLTWMIDALIFERQFDSEVETLTSKLMLIIGLLTKIRESPSLKTLLRAVLELGNLANYDYGHVAAHVRVRGKALGFKMESLMKLQDVKSADKKTNLLQYLVMTLAERSQEVLMLPEDFTDLNVVRHWETAAILSHIEEIVATYRRICDLQLDSSEQSQVESFRGAQKVFIARASIDLEKLGKLATLLKESWHKTSEYLGEESNDRKPEELFLILNQFFKSFADAIRTVQSGHKKTQSQGANQDDATADLSTFKTPHPRQSDADSVSTNLSSEYSALTRSESSLSLRPNNINKL